jgi:N6-adenosine-specific RNA methylase IME4
MIFDGLTKNGYGAIYADPPWHYELWGEGKTRTASKHYPVMENSNICDMPVADLAAPDCALFVWITWPKLYDSLDVIRAWGFEYKTCAFAWLKGNNSQPDFFQEELASQVGMGNWTRANSEVCLLATRGKPKRLNADVRQGIIAPRREHSRKPDGIHERIERLVAGPYLELFARQKRAGWDVWGNQTDKFKEVA